MALSSISRYFRLMFYVGLVLMIVPAITRTYLLMPFPGSQEQNLTGLAYYADGFRPYAAVIGALLVLPHLLRTVAKGRVGMKIGMIVLGLFLVGLTYLTSVQMSASSMFREPTAVIFADSAHNKVKLDRLVIGVEHGGVAKAYPLTLLMYHHRVQDTVGGLPVLATYCSLCHTGRVYNPIIDGVYEHFRLVGTQHYSAMLEDASTHTWWYQASGEAAFGPRAGRALEEFPSDQCMLGTWMARHPGTLVMQPDPAFAETYRMWRFDDQDRDDELDSAGKLQRWQDEGWVVGTVIGRSARAYDWNDLLKHRVINDPAGDAPVVVALENDTATFHAWKSTVGGTKLTFAADSAGRGLRDAETGSLWDWSGACIEGTRTGARLEPVYVRQQYWHSWKTFHPGTARWEGAS